MQSGEREDEVFRLGRGLHTILGFIAGPGIQIARQATLLPAMTLPGREGRNDERGRAQHPGLGSNGFRSSKQASERTDMDVFYSSFPVEDSFSER